MNPLKGVGRLARVPLLRSSKGSRRNLPPLAALGFALILVVTTSLVGNEAEAQRRGGDRVRHVPSRIPRDCSVDVTQSLNQWIAGIPDSSVVVLPRHGCYRLDGTLTIQNRHNLTIRGRGTTFRAITSGDLERRHIRIIDGSNIRISRVIVRGANPNAGLGDNAWDPGRAFQHAFTFNGVQGAVLNRVKAYDVFGDFVYIGSNYARVPSRHIKILHSTFDRNGRQGIAIVSARDVLIEGNTIANVRQAVIDLEPNTREWSVDGVRIAHNRLGPRRISVLSAAAYGEVQHISFVDNKIVGTMRVIVQGKAKDIRYSGFTFRSNSATEKATSSSVIMGFTHAEDIYVAGNTFPFGNGGTDLMGLTNTQHTLVENNTLVGVDDIFVVNDDASSDYVERNNVT
jgi:hypothetical protein